MSKRIVGFGLLLLLLAAGYPDAAAQMGTGRLTGNIKDTAGNPIVGATVTAVGAGRTLTATTDENGDWAILGFRSASYEFTFEAAGFVPQIYTRPMRQVGKNNPMDILMAPVQSGLAGTSATSGLLSEANALYEAKNYPEALAKYEEIAAAEPTLYQVYFNIGHVYRQMGDTAKAKESYEQVLAEEPEHAGALVSVGDTLLVEGRLDEAVPYFEKALVQTTDEVLPFNIAEIYFNNGDAAKAVEYYTMAAERKPDWPEPYLKLGYAHLNTGDMEAAAAAFEKVVEVAPDTPQAQMAQAALSSLK